MSLLCSIVLFSFPQFHLTLRYTLSLYLYHLSAKMKRSDVRYMNIGSRINAIKMPKIAPAATCIGVCPTYSFNFSCNTTPSSLRKSSKSRRFRTLACFPVSCRTPIASYITIIARIKLMENSKLPTPYRSTAWYSGCSTSRSRAGIQSRRSFSAGTKCCTVSG